MAVPLPWGIIVFLLGLLYGFFAHGRQDKSSLLKTALLIGVVLAAILLTLGLVAKAPILAAGGALFVVIVSIVWGLLFILGVWLGDLLEPKTRRR